MAMIVIGSETMCCMDCGGFHFLAEDGIVTHPYGDMFVVFDSTTRQHSPCPNSRKQFKFPAQAPTEAIEVITLEGK